MSELRSHFSTLRDIEAKRLRDLESAAQQFVKLQKTVDLHELNNLRSTWLDDVGNIDRAATIETLKVIQKILCLVGGEQQESHSIRRLIWALHDLLDGRQSPPLLKSSWAGGSGRPPLSRIVKMLRTAVAASVRREEQKIGSVDEAAKHVFAGLSEYVKASLSDDEINWATLRRWRWQLASGDPDSYNQFYQELYDDLIDDEMSEGEIPFSLI